jgi:hypothetical protein
VPIEEEEEEEEGEEEQHYICLVVKAPRYKPAGRVFDSRWCHWNFSVT